MAKGKVLSIRVPEETAEKWKVLAAESGMTLSDWVRGKIDEKEIRGFSPRRPKPPARKRTYTKADPELLRQLAWIGNNVNQIARRVNASDELDSLELLEELMAWRADLEAIGDAH